VNPTLAALRRRPLEMLHNIGDVHFVAINTRLRERLIEQFAGRPDERSASPILSIAGLFSHQHDDCVGPSFSEYSLYRRSPKIAGFTGGGSATHLSKCASELKWCHPWMLAIGNHL
jgi:hypothetical protein